MRRPSIGIATCAAAPDLDEDGPLLLEALAGAGADPRTVIWDAPDVDWTSFDVVLVRSTWDYPLRRHEFLDWSRRCRATANPQSVLSWNTDKRYLADLSDAGVPTVPTVFVPPGSTLAAPDGDFVLKPAVSGSAADTGRFRRGDDPAALALLAQLHSQGRTAMVQPYLPEIDVEGETSIIFLGGSRSHAVRREPLLTSTGVRRPVVVADVLSTVRPIQPTPEQVEVAQSALDAVPGGAQQLTYARVDLVPGQHGPLVLELEATDCFLFLSYAAPEGLGRLATHLLDQLH